MLLFTAVTCVAACGDDLEGLRVRGEVTLEVPPDSNYRLFFPEDTLLNPDFDSPSGEGLNGLCLLEPRDDVRAFLYIEAPASDPEGLSLLEIQVLSPDEIFFYAGSRDRTFDGSTGSPDCSLVLDYLDVEERRVGLTLDCAARRYEERAQVTGALRFDDCTVGPAEL